MGHQNTACVQRYLSWSNRPVGASWRIDETYFKVADQCKYLYRAVNNSGASTATIVSIQADSGRTIARRQSISSTRWHSDRNHLTVVLL
ncbi:MAG: IS6 family transposase [Herminiimonas sp.]|nr:IS6 family transposase [Herminiimonas sp.]